MTTYLYKAKDSSGKTISGTLDAETRGSAADAVRRMGLVPMGLTELSSRTISSPGGIGWLKAHIIYPIWTGVGVKAQMLFFRQMATMLQSGMTLAGALGNLSNHGTNVKLRRIAREAHDHVTSGGRLSDVLARYPWIFSRVQTGLISVGESAGSLDSMIDRIASYLEQEMDIRRMLRASTIYPKLLVAAAVLIPKIDVLIFQGAAAYFRTIMDMVVPILIWVLPLYIIIRLMLQFEWFRFGYDTIKVSIPILGSVVRKLSISRFARALALLYSGGCEMAQAVQISAEAVGNSLVRRSVQRAVPLISRGVPASDALRRTGQIPPMVLDMLSTGEKTGNIDMTLNKVAEYYEKESESTVKTFGVVIFVALVLAVAIVIGMQVIRFWSSFAASETNVGL